MSSELTRLCQSFFNSPINNFHEKGFTSKAIGTAKIIGMAILGPLTLGVALLYAASSGYDYFKNRNIEQNPPNLSPVDTRIQDSVASHLSQSDEETLANLNSGIWKIILHSSFREKADKIKAFIEENDNQLEILSSKHSFLLKSLPSMTNELIDPLVKKICNKGQKKEFIDEVKKFINGWKEKVKKESLNIEEKRSLNPLQRNLARIVENLEKQENPLINQKIQEQLLPLGIDLAEAQLRIFGNLTAIYPTLSELAADRNSKNDDEFQQIVYDHFQEFIQPRLSGDGKIEPEKFKESLLQVCFDLNFETMQSLNKLREAGEELSEAIADNFK